MMTFARAGAMVSALLCLSVVACANHPAWLAELSDVQGHLDKDTDIVVTVPASERVTLGVYNTDAVEVVCPAGVTAEQFCIWYEVRTIFHGEAGERDAAIPIYLPPERYMPQQGSRAVRLFADEPGQYRVEFRCNSDTVWATLNVTEPVPASDTGVGFYCDYNRFAYYDVENERRYFEDMAAHGMNTAALYGGRINVDDPVIAALWKYELDGFDYWATNVYDFRRQLDLGVETGLLDKRFPMLCLSVPEDRFVEHMDAARKGAKHADDWPELCAYSSDEAGLNLRPQVQENYEVARAQGVRIGAASGTSALIGMGDALDFWVPHVGSWTPALAQRARDEGRDLWQYICSWRGTNAPMHRYLTGVWRWITKPNVLLIWSYMHDKTSRVDPDGSWHAKRSCEYSIAATDGPISTVGFEGLRDGTVDYRVLRELERVARNASRDETADVKVIGEACGFLARVAQMYVPGYITLEPGPYGPDHQDTMVPPADCAAVREEALRLIADLKGGG